MTNITSIQEIKNKLAIKSFDCGNIELNVFFRDYALNNDRNNIGKTFVLTNDDEIIGYFTLSSAQIIYNEVPNDERLPKYPVPAARIARLAVSKEYQGNGIGSQLLKEALYKIYQSSKTIAIYCIIVDAKPESIGFYVKYGFTPLKTNKSTYYLSIKTLIDAIDQ